MEFLYLPDEILIHILHFLPFDELVKFTGVSKLTRRICSDKSFWKPRMLMKYNMRTKIYPEKSWYENFIYLNSLFKPKQLNILRQYLTKT